jgi:predicted Zn-dependent protease
MSTANRRDPKTAAKRRAAARKRTREIGKHIFAYSVIAILILGTVSAVFVTQVPASPDNTLPQVAPTATTSGQDTLAVLAKNGDDAIASGRYAEGITFYQAYLGQNPQDGEVQFKLGKAYVSDQNPQPNYIDGVDRLQRALNINSSGSYAAEAQQLIQQWGAKATEAATATAQASSAVTGTTTTTGTTGATGTTPTPNPDVMPTITTAAP